MSDLQRALEDYIAIRRTMGFKFEHSAKLLRLRRSARARRVAGDHKRRGDLVVHYCRRSPQLVGQTAIDGPRLRSAYPGTRPRTPGAADQHIPDSCLPRHAVSLQPRRRGTADGRKSVAATNILGSNDRDGDGSSRSQGHADWGDSSTRYHRYRLGGRSADGALRQIRQVARASATSFDGRRIAHVLRAPLPTGSPSPDHRVLRVHLRRPPQLRQRAPDVSSGRPPTRTAAPLGPPYPRLHDVRHTFAVHTLLDWYRDGTDVGRRLHLLSTYLGHIDPSATYWYLSAAPELLALAAERLEAVGGELS
jgi:hypothetical protein